MKNINNAPKTLEEKVDLILQKSEKIDVLEFTMKENHRELTHRMDKMDQKQDAILRSADKIATLQSKNETEIKATQGLYDTLSKHVGFAQ